MKRGDVYWVAFDPSVGGEIRKTRPAIIVSHNAFSRSSNRLQVVPLSSQISRIHPSDTLVFIQGQYSKAMADQLTTVSKLRVKQHIASITDAEMEEVEAVIKLQLAL